MDVPGWVAILTAVGGVIGGTFGAWLLQVYKERNTNKLAVEKQKADLKTAAETVESDLRLKESEQAFKIYKEIVDAMKRDMTELQAHIRAAEHAHLDCKEENAILKADARVLRAELEAIKASLGMKPAKVQLGIDSLNGGERHAAPQINSNIVDVKLGT